jgi:pyridoxal phosphate enzyme (YggS family)
VTGVSVDDVRSNLEKVRKRIAAAGGDVDRITVVGVTKTLDVDTVQAAIDAGIRAVGENYAQETVEKARAFAEDSDAGRRRPRWHFIGQLQSNKVKLLAPYVDVWHTVDSVKLVNEIAKRQPQARIFVQVNATEDPDRGGCTWADIDDIVEAAAERELVVQGLMGVGPAGEPELSRPFFRRLVTETRRRGLADVSCGMSNDFEIAVQEGATVLRLGSSLFGERTTRR